MELVDFMDKTIADILVIDIPEGLTLFISDDGRVKDVINSFKNEVIFNGKVYPIRRFQKPIAK